MTQITHISKWLNRLQQRGFVKQITDPLGLDDYASATTPVAYIGFDATAPSLHVGSLVQILMLRALQYAGGKPIILLGGGTTRVGDPSGRDASRPLLDDDGIADNLTRLATVFEHFLTFGDGPTDAVLVNNADWLDSLGYIDFLREYGPCFTVNTMIRQETVARRLNTETPCTFLEFNYALLQAYDFLELLRRHNCRVQMGGSDQWGNIVAGIELCRRKEGVNTFGLTAPLVTTAGGTKMGKTAQGAVWLDAALCSPYHYWQYWRNCNDADVGRFLRLFTDLPLTEIAQLDSLQGAEINDAKIILANATTTMLHGAKQARQSEQAAREVFDGSGTSAHLPTVTVSAQTISDGYPVVAASVDLSLASSRSQARRHIAAGALRVNGRTVSDQTMCLQAEHFDADGQVTLSIGRKRHALIRLDH